ncbi:MAG: hypothetical protein ACKVI4_17795 [Actinomycetales bacterium]
MFDDIDPDDSISNQGDGASSAGSDEMAPVGPLPDITYDAAGDPAMPQAYQDPYADAWFDSAKRGAASSGMVASVDGNTVISARPVQPSPISEAAWRALDPLAHGPELDPWYLRIERVHWSVQFPGFYLMARLAFPDDGFPPPRTYVYVYVVEAPVAAWQTASLNLDLRNLDREAAVNQPVLPPPPTYVNRFGGKMISTDPRNPTRVTPEEWTAMLPHLTNPSGLDVPINVVVARGSRVAREVDVFVDGETRLMMRVTRTAAAGREPEYYSVVMVPHTATTAYRREVLDSERRNGGGGQVLPRQDGTYVLLTPDGAFANNLTYDRYLEMHRQFTPNDPLADPPAGWVAKPPYDPYM